VEKAVKRQRKPKHDDEEGLHIHRYAGYHDGCKIYVGEQQHPDE
jgi:hypothetical protein